MRELPPDCCSEIVLDGFDQGHPAADRRGAQRIRLAHLFDPYLAVHSLQRLQGSPACSLPLGSHHQLLARDHILSGMPTPDGGSGDSKRARPTVKRGGQP